MHFNFDTLTIRHEPGSPGRVSWGDRERGYLELFPARPCAGAGYRRGELTRLRDAFAVRAGNIRDRSREASRALPGEFRADGIGLALLLERAAAWVGLDERRLEKPSGKADGLALVLPRCRSPWVSVRIDGVQAWARGADRDGAEAVAVASSTAFKPGRARMHGGLRAPAGERVEAFYPEPGFSSADFYLAWGKSAQEAAEKAAALAKEEAIQAHRAAVADFFSGASLSSADAAFDKAAAWAAFSGWSLVAREEGLGIWAGLPWFRDNWGRDTFIALPGILLASGRFGEAREVLAAFAERQDRDPASPSYGRVPNRWRGPDDVIYNTADGTPLFIRGLWHYLQYTGDEAFARELAATAFLALDADLARRDEEGFLPHGEADSWMDARIEGKEAWSARGDCAVEVQSYFYEALLAGSRLAALSGDESRRAAYDEAATRLKASFKARFWHAEERRLADRLRPDGQADLRARPNAFLALGAGSDSGRPLLEPELEAAIVADLVPELVYPYGVASLSQEDPLFHPDHDGSPKYHKDAAYHNGTVWGWLAGPAIEAMLRYGAYERAFELTKNLAGQILQGPTPGALAENLHAHPGPNGEPIHSGAYLQAWSVSEFVRAAFQGYLGFKPALMDGRLDLAPRLPEGLNELEAEPSFGEGGTLAIRARRQGRTWELKLSRRGTDARPLRLKLELPGPTGPLAFKLELPGSAELQLRYDEESGRLSNMARAEAARAEAMPAGAAPVRVREAYPELTTLRFAEPRRAPWNLPTRGQEVLKGIILSGRYDAGPAATLAAWYDSAEFASAYHSDDELGALWSAEATSFRLWAPSASRVQLLLWERGDGDEDPELVEMALGRKGVWVAELSGDLHGRYYAYRVRSFGLSRLAVDPYGRSAGLNGRRGMVLDPERAAPKGWERFVPPSCDAPNDAVVYEAHVRDLTSHPSWLGPRELAGTYLGAAYSAAASVGRDAASAPARERHEAFPTGFDYLRALGVSHVQLLPVFDFVSVDEARVHEPEYAARREGGAFNWGYDPGNYAAPEGSYASDPRDGEARVRELRSLVQALGQAGMGVVMDVVYNHVPEAARSALDACVPGYYFRGRRDSGAGDDTASERPMFRRYMSDTLAWWLSGYKLSGFRFDLMGLHDVETMRFVEARLKDIKPDLLLYGEGWDMYRGAAPLKAADQRRIRELPGYGMFNDAFRDGVKGSVLNAAAPGWLHGGALEESVKFGVVGATRHPQVRNKRVVGTAMSKPWGERSGACLNYVEIHDNLTLRDKLELTEPGRGDEYYARLSRLALTLTLSAQGLPIVHAGQEFYRTKRFPESWAKAGGLDKAVALPDGSAFFCHDSYKFSDELNALDWERARREESGVAYARGLIALRRREPLLRLRTGAEIRRELRFLADAGGLLAWSLGAARVGGLCVLANARAEAAGLSLPAGSWRLVADSAAAEARLDGSGATIAGEATIPAKGALILKRIA